MTGSATRALKTTYWLVAAAFLLRALVPVGWMPMVTDGGVRLMLCSGSGAVELHTLASSGGDQAVTHAHMGHANSAEPGKAGHGEHEAPRDLCPFGAISGQSFDLAAQLPSLGIPALQRGLESSDIPAAKLPPLRGLLPPATGPPNHA